VAVSSEGIALH